MDYVEQGIVVFTLIVVCSLVIGIAIGFVMGRNTGPSQQQITQEAAWSFAQICAVQSQLIQNTVKQEVRALCRLWQVSDEELEQVHRVAIEHVDEPYKPLEEGQAV